MKKPVLSAKNLFVPIVGYTDNDQARYIILFDPFTKHHQCKWESIVEIDGEMHIIHVASQIPNDADQQEWLRLNNPQAIEKLETFYLEYMSEREKAESSK